MIRTATIFMIGAFLLHVGVTEVVAQGDANPRPIFGDKEATQRIDDYLNLLHQGYSELEIFQDLGNANLLSENYESAAFWFERLLENTAEGHQRDRIQKRFAYARDKSLGKLTNDTTDWSKAIMDDYRAPGPSQYFMNASTAMSSNENEEGLREGSESTYAPKLAITGNGNASKEQVAHMLKTLLSLPNIPDKLDATDALAVAVCHYFQEGSPTSTKGGWKSFIKDNPGRVK